MHRHDVPIMAGIALVAFIFWGSGHLALTEMEHTLQLKEQCIAAGKQVVEGNCINE